MKEDFSMRLAQLVLENQFHTNNLINMNGYTFRGSNSVIFIVASHINWGHLTKERICSHRSTFFSLREDPILGRLCLPNGQKGSHENCLPLKTWRKKIKV